MKPFALTLSLVVLLSPQAFSQSQSEHPTVSPCALTLAQSPVIRGVKLGMSAQDLFALFPGSAERDEIKSALAKVDEYPHFGLTEFYIGPSDYPTRDRFAGINQYYFVLFDGRVIRFQVYYSGPPIAPQWSQVDDFVAKVAEALQLPPATQWVRSTERTGKSLKCNGFQMEAEILNAKGSLIVSIPDFDKKRNERRAAYDEKLRREFKP
jgi:hypothetical protein